MQLRTWLAVAASAVLWWGPACARKEVTQAAAEPPAMPVKIATVESRTLPVEVKSVGRVEPYSTVTMKSQITGVLQQVHFEEGQFVKEGDVLFEIDPRPYEEALRQTEATLLRDRALLQQAEANVQRDRAAAEFSASQAARIRKLVAEGVFAQEQLEQAEADLKSKNSSIRADEATVESVRAAVRSDEVGISTAKLNLSYCRISAPVSGRTGNLALKRGNLIKATDVDLVSILQIRPIYVTFAVPQGDLPEVRRRMLDAKLLVTAVIQDVRPDSVEGGVTFLDNAVDPATGTIRLKGTFDNTNDKLWPGQFVEVRLRLNEISGAAVVPPQAVLSGQLGDYVYVVKPDNTVEQRLVKISLRTDQFLAVAQGLQPGEKVVTDGQVRLAPGSKVKVGS